MSDIDRFKKNTGNFFQKYKHAWILLYVCIYLPWFAYVEKTVTTNFHVIHMKVDDYIPFVEFFIIPYMLWFAYVAVTIAFFLFTNKEDFYRVCTFLFVGMTVFLLISTLYPNGHYLRPHTFARDNIFTHIVQWLYATDTATNLFPSIHVYNSLGIHFAIRNSKSFRDNRKVKAVSFVLMTSIILSTVFLKQHSVFDVITAFVMAAVMYPLVYAKSLAPSRSKAYKKQLNRI